MNFRPSRNSLRNLLRYLVKPLLGSPLPFALQRIWLRLASLIHPTSEGALMSSLPMHHLSALRASPKNAVPRGVVLYLHGGGYCVGSPETHRGIVSHLADAAEATVYSLDYRLAPRHPFPAGLEDALAAYQWLLDQGTSADRIAFAGDSAGGGLALATALAARDEGLPMPASIVTISPWVDLTCSSPSVEKNAAVDPMLRPAGMRHTARAYLGAGVASDDSSCSPLFADLRELPPVSIHVGTDEVLLDDAKRLAARLEEAGVEVSLNPYLDMWHVFPLHAGLLDVADEAIGEMGAFLVRHWDTPAEAAITQTHRKLGAEPPLDQARAAG